MKKLPMVLIFGALACAPAEEKATGDTLATIDTLKPATAVAAPDSTALNAGLPRSDSTKRVSAPSGGAPRTTKGRDSIIGRDSVIPMRPNRPRLDTVKKPPQ